MEEDNNDATFITAYTTLLNKISFLQKLYHDTLSEQIPHGNTMDRLSHEITKTITKDYAKCDEKIVKEYLHAKRKYYEIDKQLYLLNFEIKFMVVELNKLENINIEHYRFVHTDNSLQEPPIYPPIFGDLRI